MRLWIAEKPDAGRKIAAALGQGTARDGYIEVGNNVVTWAIGHLLEGLMPHEYEEQWKKWSLESLPILPQKFQNKPSPDKAKQLRVIVGLIKKAKEVVIASDAAREGEYIAWEILDYAGWKGPALRFWTSALNPDGIAKAIKNLIDDSEKKPMYIAARLRSAIDWSDGVNFSRLYNIRNTEYGDRVLSIGRVQTATLAILVDRDLEIENFKPRDYYEVKATFNLPEGQLELIHAPQEDDRIFDKEKAEEIARRARGVETTLEVQQKAKVLTPPNPFNLTELQTAASSRWGWGTKKTLDVAQQLYDAGCITYPRTSSGYLNEVMKNDMPAHMSALRKMPEYAEFAKNDPVIRSKMFNDKKIEDHHGIIPTTQPGNPAKLGPDAEKLFDIIARRFLAAMMPDAKGFTTTISAKIPDAVFKVSGFTLQEAGWKAVWGKEGEPKSETPKKGQEDEENESRVLPPVKNGTRATPNDVGVMTRTTKPPARFTEASLVVAMETAGKRHEDDDVRDILRDSGIGTVATRPDMIEKIKFRGFAKIDGKKIISILRGRELIQIIREEGNRLADIAATADLERDLREIEKDPARAATIWRDYASNLHVEMDKLKRTPPRRKLTPDPQGKGGGKPSGGKPSGGKTNYSAKGKPSGRPYRSAATTARSGAGARRRPTS